jgi:hypothetical protein
VPIKGAELALAAFAELAAFARHAARVNREEGAPPHLTSRGHLPVDNGAPPRP